MDNTALEDLIKNFIVKRCGGELAAPVERGSKLSDYKMDSLDLIDLQFEIEERFGVTIDDTVPIFNMTLGEIEDHVLALQAHVEPSGGAAGLASA
jgi:acyl carrier protein